jgi:integrase
MTTAPARVVVGASFPFDRRAWASWLRERTTVDWRPGEWDPRIWLFTGDLESDGTAAWPCQTTACEITVRSRRALCVACRSAWKRCGQDLAVFTASYVPPRLKSPPGSVTVTCQVARDGVACCRPRHCRGLCCSHYRLWQRHYQHRTTFEQWLATANPYTDVLECLVPGCGNAALDSGGLCGYHSRAWSTDNRRHGRTEAATWAARQPPYTAMHQFSLLPLDTLVRLEVLYGLRHRDRVGRGVVEPYAMRVIVRALAGVATTLLDQNVSQLVTGTGNNARKVLRNLCWSAQRGFEEFTGVEPTSKDILDLRAVGLQSVTPGGTRRNPGTADLRQIQQPWLRTLLQQWVEADRPRSDKFGRTLRAVTLASRALSLRPGGGHDPAALQFADVTAVVDTYRVAVHLDGQRAYSPAFRRSLAGSFFALLDFGRSAGLIDTLSGAFARHPTAHQIALAEANEDEIGKAIPEQVIRQLDAYLDLLGGPDAPGGRVLPAEDLQAMYQMIYVVLRDTGRRPEEVAALPRDCLETEGGDVSLVWNNRKGRRHRRRLPITTETAHAIRAWQSRRERLITPACSAAHLFPALTDSSGYDHLPPSYISEAILLWVRALPELHDDGIDAAGDRLPFDRSRIFPYAFRHSYAQRHADAGTPLDVLKELMDHRSASTTLGYYQVSLKRKREAVKTLSAHVVDRRGTTVSSSVGSYELRSVAVPYGGCTEPSNVKAGGRACPIRFQCAGCGFYRPDPSYLPAIEQHINDLRADRESAEAMDTAEFVITAISEEIAAYETVTATMRRRLAELPNTERAEIEQASAVLRKARISHAPALLPLTVLTRNAEDPR